MPATHPDPHEQLVRTMARIYDLRLTTASGGNLSIHAGTGEVWITPARVDKGALQPRDIVLVPPAGPPSGIHPPSSELPFHREIYRVRPDIHAIVHAHPGALVGCSICGHVPDTSSHPPTHAICGEVVVAPYACTGSEELGANIARAFATGAHCVLLENHGVVTTGRDMDEAFARFETLEHFARALVFARSLGSVSPAPDGSHRSVEHTLPTPPAADTAVHERLREFLQRGSRQRLFTEALGACSARIPEGHAFLASRLASSHAAKLHAALLGAHPDVGSVISTFPVHAGAFCLSDTSLSTHTIPESYFTLRQIKRIPHRCIDREATEIAAGMSLSRHPVLLIANEGVVVLGRDLFEAYDRLEVLDATAEALLLSRPLGSLSPLRPEAMTELRRKFDLP